MFNTRNHSFFKKHADSFIAGILGFITLVATTQGKVDITTDSIVYIHAAKSIFCCHAFTQFNGSPLVEFPFFYPFIIGLVQMITRTTPVAFGPYLNGLLFALLIFLTGYILENIAPEKRYYKWGILLLTLSSPSLLLVYGSLWSETLFNVEVLLFLICFYKYSQTHSLRSLTWVISITAFACITRYAAISLIVCGCFLLILDRELPLKKKLAHGILFSAGSICLLLVNLIRNYLVQGSATGVRQKGTTSLKENLFYYGQVIASWIPGLRSATSLSLGIGIAVLFSLLVICSIQYTRSKSYTGIGQLSFFTLIYSLFFLAVSSLFNFEHIDNRFLTPFYIPLLISLTYWTCFITLRGYSSAPTWRTITIAGIYIFLLILQVQGYPLLKKMNQTSEATNYTNSYWQNTDIVRFLKTHKNGFRKNYSFYSNSNEALYFFAGLPSDRLPQKINKPEINDFLEQDSIYIVWFNRVKASDEISDTFFLQNKSLKPLEKFKDGAIYISEEDDDE